MTRLVDKGFKFRLYPTQLQKQQFEKMFGSCRFVYNYFLASAIEDYANGVKFSSVYDNQKKLTVLKKAAEFSWLRESDSQALNQAIANLGVAFDKFFHNKGNSGYPKFKRKSSNQSYTTFVTGGNQLAILNNRIYIPKVGWVKLKQHRQLEGRTTSGTVSKTPSGKYFISLHCTQCPVHDFNKTNSEIGIDLGIDSFLTDNTNNKIPNPRLLNKSFAKLERAQQQLSNKVRNSNNYKKQRFKLARLHEKLSNQRKDFLHKLSHNFIKNHDFIAAETLDVKSMLVAGIENATKQQIRALHRSISDVSWSEFLRQLSYKSEWYGKTFVQIDQYFASSQICNCCGYINPEVKDLTIRKWTCPECKQVHDRDHNAAINILKHAKEIAV